MRQNRRFVGAGLWRRPGLRGVLVPSGTLTTSQLESDLTDAIEAAASANSWTNYHVRAERVNDKHVFQYTSGSPDPQPLLASATKEFMAAVCHRLAELGTVDLDEPCTTYWAAWDAAATNQLRNVTLRHCLEFTAFNGSPASPSIGQPNWASVESATLSTFSAQDDTYVPGTSGKYGTAFLDFMAVVCVNAAGATDWAELVDAYVDATGHFALWDPPGGPYSAAIGVSVYPEQYHAFMRSIFVTGDTVSAATQSSFESDSTPSGDPDSNWYKTYLESSIGVADAGSTVFTNMFGRHTHNGHYVFIAWGVNGVICMIDPTDGWSFTLSPTGSAVESLEFAFSILNIMSQWGSVDDRMSAAPGSLEASLRALESRLRIRALYLARDGEAATDWSGYGNDLSTEPTVTVATVGSAPGMIFDGATTITSDADLPSDSSSCFGAVVVVFTSTEGNTAFLCQLGSSNTVLLRHESDEALGIQINFGANARAETINGLVLSSPVVFTGLFDVSRAAGVDEPDVYFGNVLSTNNRPASGNNAYGYVDSAPIVLGSRAAGDFQIEAAIGAFMVVDAPGVSVDSSDILQDELSAMRDLLSAALSGGSWT